MRPDQRRTVTMINLMLAAASVVNVALHGGTLIGGILLGIMLGLTAMAIWLP